MNLNPLGRFCLVRPTGDNKGEIVGAGSDAEYTNYGPGTYYFRFGIAVFDTETGAPMFLVEDKDFIAFAGDDEEDDDIPF